MTEDKLRQQIEEMSQKAMESKSRLEKEMESAVNQLTKKISSLQMENDRIK